jgi:hypothetical protein
VTPAGNRGIILVAAALLGISACRAPSGRASPEGCDPVTTELPATSSTEGWAGTYRLRLVATSGEKTGATVEGTLDLRPQHDSLRYRISALGVSDTTTTSPFYGALHLDLAKVGAVSVGSTASLDPMEPGVLVIEQRRAEGRAPGVEIMMRLGSEANRRDQQRVDGGYTALRVQQATPDRLAGTWASGVGLVQSSGYFCAVAVRQ